MRVLLCCHAAVVTSDCVVTAVAAGVTILVMATIIKVTAASRFPAGIYVTRCRGGGVLIAGHLALALVAVFHPAAAAATAATGMRRWRGRRCYWWRRRAPAAG